MPWQDLGEKEMAKAQCIAIAEHGRINIIISKQDEGYDKFRKVLDAIEKKGCTSWYGDIEDLQGKERSGLVITSNPDKTSSL